MELQGASGETKCRMLRYTNVIYLCYFTEKWRIMEGLVLYNDSLNVFH